ncbi:MAG TPA: ATP phosphoribosyltransferase regulatory subunit [Thermodesulfobacteriota bacterium]|nr:ATP phosphoribosyltransferase regulatory subunit [Thermodesulfobacteriota bacterium]
MLERFSLPQGVRDFPPEGAEEIRRVEECLLDEFTRWGYRRVITPFFESLETISVGLGDDLKDKILKFVDPSTGDVVALRPDITPQVGRIVATQLRDHMGPLRLCYNGRVIRYEERGSGKEREIFQVGCELMGLSSPEGDGEIIALAVKSLEKLGIKNLVLDIGHTGLVRFLLGKTGNVRNEIEEALKKKDQEALEKATSKAPIPQAIKRVILSLPELYGNKDILRRAKKISIIRKYVKELEDVLILLDEFQVGCEINVDLGELRGFNYYTGVSFELITPRVPSPMIIGGRYDELIEKYGYKCPATGFAVDIEALLDVATSTSYEDNKNHFVVIPTKPSLRRESIKIAESLRRSGFKVILDLKADVNLVRERIKENRSLSSYGVILLETFGKLRLIESRTGVSKEFSNLEELLSSI